MNPTLIDPAIEEIITHIKNQGEQIKALQANEKIREQRTQELYLENQKLKAHEDLVDQPYWELQEIIICLESDAVDAENEIEKVKEEKYSLYAKWQERGEEVKELEAKVQEGVKVCEGAKESMEEMFAKIKELEAKCATKDYKLTNGIVVQATQSEIDICEIYEKKLDRQFEEMDEEIKYHFRDSP